MTDTPPRPPVPTFIRAGDTLIGVAHVALAERVGEALHLHLAVPRPEVVSSFGFPGSTGAVGGTGHLVVVLAGEAAAGAWDQLTAAANT